MFRVVNIRTEDDNVVTWLQVFSSPRWLYLARMDSDNVEDFMQHPIWQSLISSFAIDPMEQALREEPVYSIVVHTDGTINIEPCRDRSPQVN